MSKQNLEYALYRGETFIACGTIKDISAETGLKRSTLSFYGSKKYRDRLTKPDEGMILIKINDDEQ